MFGLLVEVDAEIQTMAGGKAVIVTPGDVTGFLNRAIGPDDDCCLSGIVIHPPVLNIQEAPASMRSLNLWLRLRLMLWRRSYL